MPICPLYLRYISAWEVVDQLAGRELCEGLLVEGVTPVDLVRVMERVRVRVRVRVRPRVRVREWPQ